MAERTLSALIVDDEAPARRLLGLLCAEMGVQVAGEADCGEAALAFLHERSVDILFLDIAMPGIGGMETARGLPRDTRPPAIIFTTAFTAHALAAFDVGAVDYLLKPIEPDRLALALTRARAVLAGRATADERAEDHVWVSQRGDLARVDLAAVERVEAERDYVRLHVEGRSHLLRETMENIAARLPAPLFRRIHRPTIVRRDRITGLRHAGGGVWSVVLPHGATLRIGRSYLEDVRERCAFRSSRITAERMPVPESQSRMTWRKPVRAEVGLRVRRRPVSKHLWRFGDPTQDSRIAVPIF